MELRESELFKSHKYGEDELFKGRRCIDGIDKAMVRMNGVRFGDRMDLIPFQGKRRILVLQRPVIEIKTEALAGEESGGQEKEKLGALSLPRWGPQELHFKLLLCGDAGRDNRQLEENGRYLLLSLNDQCFIINGTSSYESFIERGDKLLLGFNTLSFPDRGMVEAERIELASIPLNLKVMESQLNILIEGETGTGKTQLAKWVHQQSGRGGKFVHINVSSFSTSLLESELFGHVKGAFTGALQDKKGAFLEAHRGTLFLDEVDSLPREIQTKMLLFLESREVRPVGGDKNILCDVRLIFASGKNPVILVKGGDMRQDFYYRISSGANIHLRPLRDCPEKIERLCEELGQGEDIVIPRKLVDFYKTLPWPGNIRQLVSHIKRKKIMGQGRKLAFDQYDEELLAGSSNLMDLADGVSFPRLEDLKFHYILKVYHHFNCDFQMSANILDITQSTVKSILSKRNLYSKN